ncbi:heat shock protein Hsp20 [Yoonia maricola]|uniref:Heat shock protein Hsp20 n=1 Tax=Yoonia maricola TaxID=420999 RepID=A0A2M8WMC1_9RHOB|nr:Hsp20/alpha crystallin family protein [Yoonia maricola]PJI92087.1 heat shock protein Hsp20 [Yoonia maricola]
MQTNLPPAPSKRSEPQPFFEQLQQEMEQLFDRFRGYPPIAGALPRLGVLDSLRPAIDMAETDDAVEVTAEIPGAKADDLDVSLNGDTLVIKGEKSDERNENDKNYHLVERSYGSFRRQIPLGFTPAQDAVEGHFVDGILRVSIAKPAEVKTANRKIEINTK